MDFSETIETCYLKESIISVRHEWTNLSLVMPNSVPWDRFVHTHGKPFYYLLGNIDILFIYKISYKVYKISYKIY